MPQLWSAPSGTSLGTLQERTTTLIPLPINTSYDFTLTKISGTLPPGLRINGDAIVGTPFEVQRTSVFTFVIRATINEDSTGELYFEDRTFRITIEGPDSPVWLTPEDLLGVGPNDTLFVLDTAPIDYQLQAFDDDLPAGDVLEYFIKPGNGELPPGISLTSDGRIVGITEPLIALDANAASGHFDTNQYAAYPYDFGILPSNGFSSFYYDSTFYDLSIPTRSPRKLNRFYQFVVTVTDGETEVDRKFRIYVVGDDFLRSDNTIMTGANNIFKADNTYVRTPIWLTPSNLGFRRANNYITIFLDVLDTEALIGKIVYNIENFNDDGSVSELPPGLVLDNNTGELAGRVPYQPAVTKQYKFTVRATRYTADVAVLNIVGTFYEDVIQGQTSFRIYKLEQNLGDAALDDGIDDLKELIGRFIGIGNFSYKVISVDDTNTDYDEIFLDRSLNVDIPLTLIEDTPNTQEYFFVNNISQAQRDELEGRKIKFSDSEINEIVNVFPYLEWRILNRSGGGIDINYSFTDTTQPIGSPSLTSEIERVFANSAGPVYVSKASSSEIIFRVPDTAEATRNIIEGTFVSSDSVSTDIVIEQTLSSIDRVSLTDELTRSVTEGQNLGLAILANQSFSKEISVNSDDETVQPVKDKTFTLNILGEVDSVINWNTPSNLGIINANFTSTLSVSATTTVPNARLVYTKTAGRLPPGLEILFDGQIVGKVRQFGDASNDGLTIFDTGSLTFDAGTTTVDRSYTFTVDARDRFGYSAIQRDFTITVLDPDDKLYSNIIMKPLLKQSDRESYSGLISDSTLFPPELIYRPNDPEFGLQKEIKILAYAGLETKTIAEYVAKSAKFHKRKRFRLGDIKTAVAKLPGTNTVVYEIVYVEILDPKEPSTGKTQKRTNIKNRSDKITVDSILYETKDDQFKTNVGLPSLKIGDVDITNDEYLFDSRDGQDLLLLPDDVDVTTRDGQVIDVTGETDSEPFKYRPKKETIKSDSDAVKVSDGNDIGKLISNVTNMRDQLRQVGDTERGFLPLWMRTAQANGVAELGYVTAIPLCYCIQGGAETIAANIRNSGFDFKTLNLEIDRYIIDSTAGLTQEQYIVFPDYQYNI